MKTVKDILLTELNSPKIKIGGEYHIKDKNTGQKKVAIIKDIFKSPYMNKVTYLIRGEKKHKSVTMDIFKSMTKGN